MDLEERGPVEFFWDRVKDVDITILIDLFTSVDAILIWLVLYLKKRLNFEPE